MSDFTNVSAGTPIAQPTATPTTTAPAPSTTLGQAQATAAATVGKVNDAAAPHLNAASEAAAPYLQKAQDIAAPYLQKGQEILTQAKASADKAINDASYRATDAKDRTVEGADVLATDASKTTNAAAQEGQVNLESAKTYLAGVASTVTGTVSSLAHSLDESTKTTEHPGVVTSLTNALSSVASHLPTSITSHLPTGATPASQQPVGSALHDAATSPADEAEIKEALAQLAGKGATNVSADETIAKPI